MGAYSPAPVLTRRDRGAGDARDRRADACRDGGGAARPSRGVLYAGLMITARGPEADRVQRPLRRPGGAGADAAPDERPRAGAARRRATGASQMSSCAGRDDAALTVVMAAKGYPGAYARGSEIRGARRGRGDGRRRASSTPARERDGDRLLADGGRVLERHRARADGGARRRPAPTRRSTGSTGRRASAAATSAGGRWGRNRACQIEFRAKRPSR